jgi:hypothetical protein
MERGPVALFGAIVAVGLGPAMWLGVQFGTTALAPRNPPAATSGQSQDPAHDTGTGGGAGSAPDDPSVVVKTKPRANYRPLHPTPSVSRSSSHVTTRPTPQQSTGETTTTPTPSAQPSSPPTDPTTQPTDPPAGNEPPPSPPSTTSAQDVSASV